MIEEVKTLVEAIIEQREEGAKGQREIREGQRDYYRENREGQRDYRDSREGRADYYREIRENANLNSFDFQEQSRRSLNEIDLTNLMNLPSAQIKKPPPAPSAPVGSIGASNAPLSNHTTTSTTLTRADYTSELVSLRDELLQRPERRELQELRQSVGLLSKEAVGKITFEEAEKLLLRFQKEIFIKLAQERGELEEAEGRLSRAMELRSDEVMRRVEDLSEKRGGGAKL